MVHIPLYSEDLAAAMAAGGRDCGDSVCGNPSSEANPPLPSTAAFLDTVRGAENLVCVLSGHLHSAQAQKLSGEWRADRPGDRTPLPCPRLHAVRDGCGLLRGQPPAVVRAAELAKAVKLFAGGGSFKKMHSSKKEIEFVSRVVPVPACLCTMMSCAGSERKQADRSS